MLPVALTCPAWWVARWTVRMLTSLALVIACSLGAAALPDGTGGPDWAAPATGAAPSVSGDRSGPDRALAARAGSGSAEVDVAGVVDRSVPSAGSFPPAAVPRAAVVPAGRQHALVGLTPATLGSRAPPVR